MTPSQLEGEWLSLREAADMLGMHPATVRLWADRNELPSRRTNGGHRRFRRSDLEAQLRALRSVQQRLSALLASPQQAEETPIWLTQQEIQALYEALSGFARLMRVIIPVSTLRDETIRDIEGFRETLKMTLAPAQS